jgi:hypothetical protein
LGVYAQDITYSYNDDLSRGTQHYTGSQQEAGKYKGNIASGGWRFTDVPIPPGAHIVSATLKLYAYSLTGSLSDVRTRFYGEAADNPDRWYTGLHEVGSVEKGASFVDFIPTEWSPGAQYTMPDLKAIVQEVVNRPGWTAGNALALIWTDNGSIGSYTRVASFDSGQNPTNPASLEITWASPVE